MLEEICGQILGRSFCALGDAAATPFPAALKHFPEDFGLDRDGLAAAAA